MKIIVGLGNPGEKYENTRHNLGFLALDALLEKYERVEKTFWSEDRKFKAQIKKVNSMILVKPTTFMNNSGESVSKVLNYFKIKPEDMVLIQDDLDLPFGKIRVRFGGGSGGHHGVESVINTIGSDKFLRIRLGIGNPRRISAKGGSASGGEKDPTDHVLGRVGSGEKGKVKTMIKETVRIIEQIREHGIKKYMSKYNKGTKS